MKLNKLLLLLLLLLISGLFLLSSCLPETTTTPIGEQEQPVQSSTLEESYPAPEENEDVLFADPDQPYPGPQTIIVDQPYPEPQSIIVDHPYPPIEVVGTASNLDLSDAIMPAEFAVVSSDQDLQTSSVFVEYSELILKDSDPVQVDLVIVGELPSPCHQLRVVALEPDNTGFIKVQAYSVSDPENECVQVVEPFIAIVPLGSFSEGNFTLSINNEMNGEFVIP